MTGFRRVLFRSHACSSRMASWIAFPCPRTSRLTSNEPLHPSKSLTDRTLTYTTGGRYGSGGTGVVAKGGSDPAQEVEFRNLTGSIMRSPAFSFSNLRSLRMFNNNLPARASERGPLLKDGSKVIVESSGRLLWEVVVGNGGKSLRRMEGSLLWRTCRVPLLVFQTRVGEDWGVRVLMEERAMNRSPKL